MAGVAIVCLAIAASAAYSYSTLRELRSEYLESRALDLVSAIDAQTRGGGRGGRSDPSVWQVALEEALESHEDVVALIQIVSPAGDVIAGVGERRPEDILVERPMAAPRQARRGAGQGATSDRHVRIAFDPSAVAFITRAANSQLVVAALAILTLLAVSAYSLRVLRGYLTLKDKEQEARHLASLGAMAATLAHEIRNPLGAMKGLTQVAQEQLPESHESQGHMKTVVAEAERLERLVTDLLQFARPGEPELSDFELITALEQAREMLRPELQAEGVEIHIDETQTCRVRSDSDGLRQVLLNVLLNAVEASPPGGVVAARLARGVTGDTSVTVEDDGGGLEGRNPEDLFEPFVTGKVRGSGLGLAVSRRIIERLGGSISLLDRPEGGARCTITLPRSCVEASS
jgi:signal transduction histidine kinase